MSGRSTTRAGVYGGGDRGAGVFGTSAQDRGVLGSGRRIGVHGVCDSRGSDADPTVYAGVYGQGADFGVYCTGALGMYSEAPVGGTAGYFKGSVYVEGGFLVFGGVKSAAVPHPDGTHRQLCAVESPESWFEDFGRAQLTDGRAEVALDADFAALVDTDGYHVFLAPEGESGGLYVSARSPAAFEVREQGDGKSTLGFSYRVVAKRGDVRPKRLQVVEPPARRALPDLDVAEQGPPD